MIFGTDAFHIRIWLQNPQCHQLQEWLTIQTEILPFDFEVADINNDGQLEIVVIGMYIYDFANQLGYVQIFTPTQGGYTSTGNLYMVGKGPRKVKIGNVTGDDKPDILITSRNVLDVLTQQPDGSFILSSISNPSVFENQDPNFLAIADFNSDGFQDVAIQVWGRDESLIVYYQENGTLLPGISLPGPTGTIFPIMGMTSGEINGDSLADLITFIHGNSPYAKVVIYEQMADGGFEPPKTYDTYDTPASSVTGDMDRNGTLDLVLMNTGYGTFTMHYQSLEGVFGAMTIIPAGDVQSHPFNIFSAIGDVTGDGKMDVVYLGFNDGLVVVAQGGAPNCPTITPPRARMPFFSYAVINSIEANEAVAADIDGDGRDDVLTLVQSYPNPEDSYVQVINQTVNGAFTLGNQIPMGTNAPLVGLSTGDINNDGRVDISTVTQYSWGPPGVYLAVQQEDGNFNRPVAMGNIPNAKQTYIADWTGDGLDDLAVIGDNGINIFAQLADGTLADPITYAQGQLGGTNLNDVTDWNGDGRMDIVAWWRNQTIPGDKPVRIFLQRQDGGFDLLPTIMYANIHTIAAGDIDNNSKPDIVMSHPDNVPEARMGLVYQQPDGTMAESIILSDRKYNLPGSFVISDLNFDGLNDLLVFNFGYFGTTVFTQNKQHTFDSALYYNLFTGNQDFGHSVTKIDTNHDNKPDIFVYVTNDNRVLFIKPLVTSDLFLPLIKR